eukprot:1356386-Prymnesium_polylepis.1
MARGPCSMCHGCLVSFSLREEKFSLSENKDQKVVPTAPSAPCVYLRGNEKNGSLAPRLADAPVCEFALPPPAQRNT